MLKKIVVAAGLGLTLVGCTGGGTPETQPELKATAPTVIDGVAEAYEAVRHQLANDQTEGLPAAFGRLQTAALAASAEAASPPLAEHLKSLSEAAANGSQVAGGDLQGARKAFAEASSHLVSAIAGEPSLARGLSVFECPMVDGYPKWVQTSEEKANPYMGSAMQTCGVESQWNE